MTWKQYHRLADIHGFLDYLAQTYPKIVSVNTIGKSYEGRDLKVIFFISLDSKQTDGCTDGKRPPCPLDTVNDA